MTSHMPLSRLSSRGDCDENEMLSVGSVSGKVATEYGNRSDISCDGRQIGTASFSISRLDLVTAMYSRF